MGFSLRIVNENQINPPLDRAIRAVLCMCFPADAAVFSQTRAWHGSAPVFSVLLLDQERLVAHVGIVDRVIRAGQEPVRVAGVQNMCVLPECRGQGLSRQLMEASMAEALRREMDLGMLFCLPALEKLYAKCGWRRAAVREIWARRSTGERYRLGDRNIAMVYPLGRSEFPAAIVDLNGDDW